MEYSGFKIHFIFFILFREKVDNSGLLIQNCSIFSELPFLGVGNITSSLKFCIKLRILAYCIFSYFGNSKPETMLKSFFWPIFDFLIVDLIILTLLYFLLVQSWIFWFRNNTQCLPVSLSLDTSIIATYLSKSQLSNY